MEIPAQGHSPTSVAAAGAIRPDANRLRRLVLEAIRETGGLTDEEGANLLGMGGNTYRPRRRELQKAGLIVDSGDTRPTNSGRKASVWVPS